MDYSRIPDELKNLDQWVCTWGNSKIPMRAYERKAASSSDPETWSSFEQAQWAVDKGYYDHVGFVFNNNGIVGIDIDDGFIDYLMTPLTSDIIGKCKSYTEKSKSGTGVHIFLHGDIPFDGKNNLHGVEIYKSKRFFIMTGKQLLFSQIIDNQDAIDYVVDKYFAQVEKDSKKPLTDRIYSPRYVKPERGKIQLDPEYPLIGEGGRNISLTSLAGMMHNAGYSSKLIYKELLYVNKIACKPPLSEREIQAITESITRYRR